MVKQNLVIPKIWNIYN